MLYANGLIRSLNFLEKMQESPAIRIVIWY